MCECGAQQQAGPQQGCRPAVWRMAAYAQHPIISDRGHVVWSAQSARRRRCRRCCPSPRCPVQPLLSLRHEHPVQPLQHVRQLHPLASGYHRGHPAAGARAARAAATCASCCHCCQRRLTASPAASPALSRCQVTILWCKECGRYLQPPKHWVKAEPESKELLTFCTKRIKGLQVRAAAACRRRRSSVELAGACLCGCGCVCGCGCARVVRAC